MNQKTLTVLKRSIAKWEAILSKGGADHGSKNCPLCGLFFDNGCAGCPVSAKTGTDCCDASPYEEWAEHHAARRRSSSRGEYRVYDHEPETRALAQSELDFLKSLLPQNAKGKP